MMAVRFLADENIPGPVVARLRAAGFDVEWIDEEQPGTGDVDVAALAIADDRVLLTEDHDFGELAIRRQVSLPGCVLIELPRLPSLQKGERVAAVLREHGDEARGTFMVIEPGRVRMRPLG